MLADNCELKLIADETEKWAKAQRGAFLSGRRPARLSTAAVAASVASGAAALMASAAACGNSFPVMAAPAAA
jgi:hypothetical protein